MRLWMPDEVGAISDPQEFMDTLVDRAVGILEREPIDIYVNPTYLPAASRARLRQAVDRGAHAARDPRRQVGRRGARAERRRSCPARTSCAWQRKRDSSSPSAPTTPEPTISSRCEYGLRMVQACKLTWDDFWMPRPVGERAVDRKPQALKQA